MKTISPLQTTELVKKRILSTKSWIDENLAGQVEIDISYETKIDQFASEETDFAVETLTSMAGKSSEDGAEVFSLDFTLRADYRIVSDETTFEELKEQKDEFGRALYLLSREYAAYLITQMGGSPTFLPYSLEDAKEREGSQKGSRAKKSAKPKSGTKKK